MIELLVVVGMVGALIAILLPSLARVRASAHRLTCASNLRTVGAGITAYASANRGFIPYGPQAPPMSFFNFYPVTGNVTSLISIQNGKPVGLGFLLRQYLSTNPRVLFCPGNDQDSIADAELERFGISQSQSDYYYRHGSGADTYTESPLIHTRLADLGLNRDGEPIRVLAMDVQFIAAMGLGTLNIYTRSAHGGAWSNLLFSDGHVTSSPNTDQRFTVDSRIYLPWTFGYILKAFERADVAE